MRLLSVKLYGFCQVGLLETINFKADDYMALYIH